MTALTFAVTLSLVITSCGGTSRVMTRRSIFTRRSTPNGMMKKRPGPLSAMRRPSRNTTPRSYSFAMRRLENAMITARTTITKRTVRVPNCTISSP